MSDVVAPNRDALRQALSLSEEILRNIELSELRLEALFLKASRLARLTNDFDMMAIFEYETSGYPSPPNGIPPAAYRYGQIAGREFYRKNEETKETKAYMYVQSVGQLEESLASAQIALRSAQDPNISISSANPSQYVHSPMGNVLERNRLLESISETTAKLASRRALLHRYVSRKHYELKFSGISSDIFSRLRERVDTSIGTHVPDAVRKLTAVYENLRSDNTEDWSNAVHSCRRILQDLADSLFAPQADRVVEKGGKRKTIKLGHDNYINRLIAFAEQNYGSDRFLDIVGSQLGFLGDRLDSIFQAAQKGSHGNIVTREEADRYVVYTYLIAGDLLSLIHPPATPGLGGQEVGGQSDRGIGQAVQSKD